MNPHRILVTGSDGLIGRWVSHLLVARGHEVVALDCRDLTESRERYRKHVADIRDADALHAVVEAERPDAVIHLAARTDLDESATLRDYDSNTVGVRNVCAAVRASGSVTRAVYTSSQLVCRVGYQPASDTDVCPTTVYGESKVRTEEIVREERGGDVAWCLTRPTTVWGPYMKAHYRNLLRHIEAGRYFHAGHSPLYKSYSYAGNIAHQYRQLLLAPDEAVHEKTFYLADYEPLSLRAYTDRIAALLDAKPIPTVPILAARALATTGDALNALGWRGFPYNTFRLTNILTEYVIDLSETEAVCGPLPYGFDEGVRETVAWYRNGGGAARG
jgi:nucleoside-diphosphate-sugar epimerase